MNIGQGVAMNRAGAGKRVVLHIGPPKTGTSAVQGAFHACRAEVLRQGVRYAGSGVQASTAAFAVTQREHPSTGSVPSMRHWRELVREVRAAREASILISSEFFAGASPEQIKAISDAFGSEQLTVVITLRPIVKILASRWQQNVQEGAKVGYSEWLHAVLEEPASTHAKRFWSRQRHDELVARWASVIGPDRVTVIAVDDRDHDGVLREFEQLLGLKSGTLVSQREAPNRSMTLEEIEVVRAFNAQFEEEALAPSLRYKLMARGAATHLKRRAPLPTEQKIETPRWAMEQAAAVAREMIMNIQASRVTVVGNLELLTTIGILAESDGDREGTEVRVSPEIAARSAMGILLATGATRGYEKSSPVPAWGEPYDLQRIPSQLMARIIVQRVVTAVLRRLGRGVKR